ncbi:hypothetical protein Emag_002908 [Eimeria magna]
MPQASFSFPSSAATDRAATRLSLFLPIGRRRPVAAAAAAATAAAGDGLPSEQLCLPTVSSATLQASPPWTPTLAASPPLCMQAAAENLLVTAIDLSQREQQQQQQLQHSMHSNSLLSPSAEPEASVCFCPFLAAAKPDHRSSSNSSNSMSDKNSSSSSSSKAAAAT